MRPYNVPFNLVITISSRLLNFLEKFLEQSLRSRLGPLHRQMTIWPAPTSWLISWSLIRASDEVILLYDSIFACSSSGQPRFNCSLLDIVSFSRSDVSFVSCWKLSPITLFYSMFSVGWLLYSPCRLIWLSLSMCNYSCSCALFSRKDGFTEDHWLCCPTKSN